MLGRLAAGGMAELFLARPTGGTLRDVVVLKRIKPQRSGDPKFVSMFLDEAKLASRLRHANIARVHDTGRLGESYFFTMEYIHGEDVRALLARLAALKRHLPIGRALYIAAAVSAGLHHAHELRGPDGQPLDIVHRDVSPSNVMVGFDGAVKLVDFGIAKAKLSTVQTEAGAVKGKVTYFSPEQCRGQKVDRRSDVFSLGVLLHEMLTGRRLYKRESDFHTMRAILHEDAPPPSQFRRGITPAIDRIVVTALARDPARRYATAGEMSAAIDAVAERDGISVSARALGALLRELFGARPEPWVELAHREEQPTIVTVTSALAQPSSAADHAIEAELSNLVQLRPGVDDGDPADTEVSAPGALDAPAPDGPDEWEDEAVTSGEARVDAPVIDPAAVISEVRVAAVTRMQYADTESTGFDARDYAKTTARAPRPAAPAPAAADPALIVGDRRTSMVIAAVRPRRRLVVVAIAAIVTTLAAALVIALTR